MKTKRFNSLSFGLLLGVLSPLLGFVLYGVYWSLNFNRTFSYFVNDLFIDTPSFRPSIITLSLLINLIPFFVFIRSDRYQSARGVILAVFLYVPVVLYFKFA